MKNRHFGTLDVKVSIGEVISVIDQYSGCPCIILGMDGKFKNIVTDGDIRRALLRDRTLDTGIIEVIEYKTRIENRLPITCQNNKKDNEMLKIMNDHNIQHLPILDSVGRIIDLASKEDLMEASTLKTAVIMAGGLGSRLRPLTNDLPKPMLPVKGRPLLEIIVDQLSQQGITNLFISTYYKSEKIIDHFSNGVNFGINIEYLQEERLTGTAGALALLPSVDSPVLVLNGDVYTNVSFKRMMQFHNEHQADMTIGAWQYEYQIKYGILNTKEYDVVGISEKPVFNHSVNTGMYILSSVCLELIPQKIDPDQLFHMTDLLGLSISKNLKVVSFPIYESWLDIGSMQDYKVAQKSEIFN